MISCWLVDCCPQRFSFRYFVRSPMCYFHLCFSFLICTDAMHWIRVVISMVLFSCLRFSLTQRLTCRLTCWIVHGIVDDLMLGLLDLRSVCRVFSIRLYTVICSSIRIGWQLHQSLGWLIDRSVDVWLIGWSTDRSIDSFIDWLVFGWEAIVAHSFGLTYWFYFSGALRPWTLWPLGVSVGPSWVCRADFSDGTVQNSVLFRPAWRWPKNTHLEP